MREMCFLNDRVSSRNRLYDFVLRFVLGYLILIIWIANFTGIEDNLFEPRFMDLSSV
jgi:hypothetical protein